MGERVHSEAEVMADLRYEEWPGEDYPRIASIKTRGTAGLLRVRSCLERLASDQDVELDVFAELPAISGALGRCIWHSTQRPFERSVALGRLPDGRLSVDWYASSSWWRELVEVFDCYLAASPRPVARPGTGPFACLYPDVDTQWDAVFEAEPCVWESLAT